MEIIQSKRGGPRPGSGRPRKGKAPFRAAFAALDHADRCQRRAATAIAAARAALADATPFLDFQPKRPARAKATSRDFAALGTQLARELAEDAKRLGLDEECDDA